MCYPCSNCGRCRESLKLIANKCPRCKADVPLGAARCEVCGWRMPLPPGLSADEEEGAAADARVSAASHKTQRVS